MIQVVIQHEAQYPQVGIYIRNVDEKNGKVSYAIPSTIIFREVSDKDIGSIIEPTFKFSYFEGTQFLQALAQALVDAGFRDAVVSKDGEIRRIENHLNDMRRLVFDDK